MSEGVTTIEIKSGYGLELETELKQLRVALRLGRELGVTVQPTLLAAHAVPKEFQGRTEDYVDWICQEMIPAAKEFAPRSTSFAKRSLSVFRRLNVSFK